MDRKDAEAELGRLREAIDRVDEVLVKLLNQRAKYAVEIGEIKGHLSLPVYAPEREKEVLRHVEAASQGPLDGASVRRLFERIIDESRRVERESAEAEGGELRAERGAQKPAGDSSAHCAATKGGEPWSS